MYGQTDRQTDRPHELHVYVGLAQAHPNKANFDVRHRADVLDPLDPGQSVWITGRRDSGIVVQPTEASRFYLVSTQT